MANEPNEDSKDIQLEYSKESGELIIGLSNEGIEYIKNILMKLQDSETDSHWHIDHFDGWLGGDFKHLIIMKTD